jgi:hypothetical protein
MVAEFFIAESSWLFANVYGCSPRVAVKVDTGGEFAFAGHNPIYPQATTRKIRSWQRLLCIRHQCQGCCQAFAMTGLEV